MRGTSRTTESPRSADSERATTCRAGIGGSRAGRDNEARGPRLMTNITIGRASRVSERSRNQFFTRKKEDGKCNITIRRIPPAMDRDVATLNGPRTTNSTTAYGDKQWRVVRTRHDPPGPGLAASGSQQKGEAFRGTSSGEILTIRFEKDKPDSVKKPNRWRAARASSRAVEGRRSSATRCGRTRA